MPDIDQIKRLLKRVELIAWKYRQIFQGPQYRFNIFTILRQEDDEVNLHSRFLAELLDPHGDHCQDCDLLAAFLRQVGIEGFQLKNVSVRREYRDIDMLVTNDEQAVIIENKIYAQDQERQLERYYHAIRDEGFDDICVIYLTLHGDVPSRYSLGGLPDRLGDDGVYSISYEDDIHDWLETCIQHTCRHPGLRETLVQYQRLIERLTGQSLSKGYIMEIKELLEDETNIELAVNISRAMVEAQVDIQFAFWEELERQLQEMGYRIAKESHYDPYARKKVERYYETEQAGWYYGITIELADYDEQTKLVFYIKVRRRVYYGFAAFRDGSRDIAQESAFDHLAELVKEVIPSADRTAKSIGLKKKPALDFDNFDTPTVWALANPEKREQIVSQLVEEVAAHIDHFMALYVRDLEAE